MAVVRFYTHALAEHTHSNFLGVLPSQETPGELLSVNGHGLENRSIWTGIRAVENRAHRRRVSIHSHTQWLGMTCRLGGAIPVAPQLVAENGRDID